MLKKFQVNFRITLKDMSSMRSNVFDVDTLFNVKGLYANYTASSTDYRKRSMNDLRNFIAYCKPLITMTPNKTMGAGLSGLDNDKFIQIGIMPLFGIDSLNLQPYIAIVRPKKDGANNSRIDSDPQVSVFPLTLYDVLGNLTFSINPYVPYRMLLNIDIDLLDKIVVAELIVNNLLRSPTNPLFTRWHLALSGDLGYSLTSNDVLDTMLSTPFQVYPIGMLDQPRMSGSLSSAFSTLLYRALTAWYGLVKPSGSQRIYCLGKWSATSSTDDSFNWTLFGTTANSSYGIKHIGCGASKFPLSSNIDNLLFFTDFFLVDTDSRFKNIRTFGTYGPMGYNHLSINLNFLSQKRDGRIIRDTALIKLDKIDKGLFIASLSNKTVRQTVSFPSMSTFAWWLKIHAGMGNYYYPHDDLRGDDSPFNTVLFHMPWAVWDASTLLLLFAPVVVGPLRRSRIDSHAYNQLANYTITSSTRGPLLIGVRDPKAPMTKFGIAHRTPSGTQFYFDSALTGLVGATRNIKIDYRDYNFFRIQKNGTTATLLVNNYPMRSITSLSGSYTRALPANVTFNNRFYAKVDGLSFVYPGLSLFGSSLLDHVNLQNLGVSGWRQLLLFPIELMDFNYWSNTNYRLAKLSNIALSKKTGNLTIDFISARKTIVDDLNSLVFDFDNDATIFDFNYRLSAVGYAPPTTLSYDSISRIQQYFIDVPYRLKGQQISNILYVKGPKLGPPGRLYYRVTVQRYILDADLFYIGQTGSDDVNRMDNISLQNTFTDAYLNTSVPGNPPFKTLWNLTSSAVTRNSTLSRGYRIGMAVDLNVSHCARTGLDYYVNVYSTLRKNFTNRVSGHSLNWNDSRFTFNSSRQKYILFKVDIPVVMFKSGATPLLTLTNLYTPYDVAYRPASGVENQFGYPSTTSLSAWGYYDGDFRDRGYLKNVVYSYRAVLSTLTRDVSTSAVPVTGGMWKAVLIGDTVSIRDIILSSNLKFKFEVI